ncbi:MULTISPECIES: helix-turn-helix domain-containing protein [Pseudomonas]|jgi:transcriptional regulator with XRE-family HTH domain|uniref:Helix-turn-helix transcriptional regulator n=1 Tax=Pseudomonas extremaustralis TaxID=359110 RepID=A0A5C5Q4K7_9PSED|nr:MULTISPECIES: helix-turn-helix transcriptional regulator [Pseudomonas]HCE9341588.1 helix-turn-helix transcriptional regulator [Pseudomonas aeruginosa]EZI24112.1 DNA-binding protein [Pseudomonas extremaustralis 14-3 substr. 14-3b]MBJ2281901.1 helix-turn-helix transcriptional regulator [Pseudomonas sp. MF6767]MCO8310925.1 helix-turn-helix domain-containing protein [Pseudomonas mandelii]MDN5485958.1 helix-turn-helix domain-containing protein [Pseudomonas sp.]
MTQDYEQLRLHLAENIRLMRRVKNLTQEQLALMAEVDRTYVSQIERCTGNPSLMVLCKLANILEITTDQLLTESDTLRRALSIE